MTRFLVSLTGLALCLALWPHAAAQQYSAPAARTIFVQAGAPPGGDGSAQTPYRRITDAVVDARTIRHFANDRIIIHVAAGTYVGSYDAAALGSNPDFEILPIILNVSKLALRGETTLTEDDRGLPTGTETGTETVITSDRPLAAVGQSLLVVAPTTDGMEPNDVTVSEFVLDAQIPKASSLLGRAIIADRALGFVIRHNLIRHASTGINTRLASGIIQGNLLVNNTANGIGATGGSQAQPAEVVILGNRATENLVGLILAAIANTFVVQLGQNEVTVSPLQTTFNRDDPLDATNIPDTLAATVTENDFSGNSSAGLRCFFLSPNIYNTSDATQPITGTIVTTVQNNLLRANGDYGIDVDAGFPVRSIPRELIGTFESKFSENDLGGNTRAPAFFGFTRLSVSLGIQPRSQFKYLQDSRFDAVASDGEFAAFDFDNPASDPFNGTALRNRLTINGNAISGTLIH